MAISRTKTFQGIVLKIASTFHVRPKLYSIQYGHHITVHNIFWLLKIWRERERERERKHTHVLKNEKQKIPHCVGTVPKSNSKNRKRKKIYCDIWTKTTGFIYAWY
jgi:hypothetical protein